MDEERKTEAARPKDAWTLRLYLDVPSSCLPAIQYTIFSEDPFPRFKALLIKMEKPWLAQLNEIEDNEKRETVKQLQRACAWKHLFHSVPGDKVYLLVSGSVDNALMSSSSPGKKWVVSMPVVLGERRLCWSVSFEAIAGREIEVKLSEDTALDLAAIHSSANQV